MIFPRSGKPAPDTQGTALSKIEFPLEIERRLNARHHRAGIENHLNVLFKDARVGDLGFLDLYRSCLDRTGTSVTPFNAFNRFQTRLNLLRYFLATLSLEGARAECGVYRGATSLLICETWRSQRPDFDGGGYFLIDSFAGTSESNTRDLIPVRRDDGSMRLESFFPAGKSDTSPELVRRHLRDFPGSTLCSGWIPEVFKQLPACDWALIHLDVTLYLPTLAALEYFVPRLCDGGVVYCDGSIFCPGVQQAVEEYCDGQNLPYVVLGNRDFVIVKA